MEIKKVIETHNKTGMAGLARLAEEYPDTKDTVEKVMNYITENYKLTPNGRCWPGDLEGKEIKIRRYIEYKI